MNLPPFQLGLTAVTIAAWTLHENEIYRWMFLSPWWICQTLLGRENWDLLNGMGQSCCRPEGDQKRSDRGEKFLGYFSLRTSVVQQPETFVQNSNFANASLLRNLVLHYSFHLKTPPWKLWQHENLFEVLVDEGSARVVVNLFPKWVVGSAHVIEPITQILFAQWELTAEKFLEGVTLFCVPNLNISLWINAVPLILLGRGSYGSYKMNIIDKNSVPILGTGPREKDNCKSEYVCRKVWGRKWPLYFGLLKAIL